MIHEISQNSKSLFEQRIQQVMTQAPLDNAEYYCFTATADKSGEIMWSIQTSFVGFAENTPHFELRAPTSVKPQKMRDLLLDLKEPPIMVNSVSDFLLFLLLGGHGIIRKEIAEQYLPELVTPRVCAPRGTQPGFVRVDSVPKSKFVKRPRKWLKQDVKKRDDYECKLCGTGSNEEGVLLTLHHITMREFAGFTEKDNLITICKDCHEKLHQMSRSANLMADALYELIGIDRYKVDTSQYKYQQGVKNYRKVMFAAYLQRRKGC